MDPLDYAQWRLRFRAHMQIIKTLICVSIGLVCLAVVVAEFRRPPPVPPRLPVIFSHFQGTGTTLGGERLDCAVVASDTIARCWAHDAGYETYYDGGVWSYDGVLFQTEPSQTTHFHSATVDSLSAYVIKTHASCCVRSHTDAGFLDADCRVENYDLPDAGCLIAINPLARQESRDGQ